MHETAYAKINLALHVRGRREDGYHELETLFAFVDGGDVISARKAERDEVRTFGEFGQQLTDPFGNIVAKAMSILPHEGGIAIDLEKNLPVAAGLGGGSADAGAVFRIVERMQGLPGCVESRTCVGRGTGTELEPIDNDLAGTAVLLVNPRVPLSTGPVFQAWDGKDRGPLPTGSVEDIALGGRNDLERPAIGQCPVIADVLAALHETNPFLARMSGSGATCFALYRSHDVMREAAEMLASWQPGWWKMQGKLR